MFHPRWPPPIGRPWDSCLSDGSRVSFQTETNPEIKKLWEFLACEENKHYVAMDEMVRFVLATDVWHDSLAW